MQGLGCPSSSAAGPSAPEQAGQGATPAKRRHSETGGINQPSHGWVLPSKESQQASYQSKGEAVPTPRMLLHSSLCVFLRRLRGQLPCMALSFAGKNRGASPSKYIKFRSVIPKHSEHKSHRGLLGENVDSQISSKTY